VAVFTVDWGGKWLRREGWGERMVEGGISEASGMGATGTCSEMGGGDERARPWIFEKHLPR